MSIGEEMYRWVVEQAQAALRESEERFQALADSAPMLIWVSGRDKLCTFFNKTWLDFTGRSMEQERGNGWAEGIHSEDLDRCLATYNASFDARWAFPDGVSVTACRWRVSLDSGPRDAALSRARVRWIYRLRH